MSEQHDTTPPVEAGGETPAAPEQTTVPDWASGVPKDLVRDTPEDTIQALNDSYKSAIDLVKKRRSDDGLGLGEPAETKEPRSGSFTEKLEAVGLDGDSVAATFAEKGKLTRTQYSKLEEAGYSKSDVDRFLVGQQAIEELARVNFEQIADAAVSAAGGEAEYARLAKWGEDNLSEADLKTLIEQIKGPKATKTTAKMAVQFLRSESAVKQQGRPVDAGGKAPPPARGYSTRKEVKEALAQMKKRGNQGQDTSEIRSALAATPEHIRNGNHR